MVELLANPQVWASLLTLTVMEIVLGIDNIVFISVIVSRLPAQMADRARKIGLALALIFRIILLAALSWLVGLTAPVFSAFSHDFSWRDLILIGGGLFLLFKATHEIHKGIEGEEEEQEANPAAAAAKGFAGVIAQIIVIDLVFSIDSIITAIGMAQHIEIMVAAVILAMMVMYAASGPVSGFIKRHPTTKMLALSFLLLIGVSLIADGLGFHIPRGYIYFAMAFSAGVELVNVLAKSRRKSARH